MMWQFEEINIQLQKSSGRAKQAAFIFASLPQACFLPVIVDPQGYLRLKGTSNNYQFVTPAQAGVQ